MATPPLRPPTLDTRLIDRRSSYVAAAFVLAWSALAIRLNVWNPVVINSDQFGYIDRARALSLDSLEPWVNGLTPLGYPLLLRLLFPITSDYEVSGRILSVIAGATLLAVVYRLGSCLFDRRAALLGMVICALTPWFLTLAASSNTDLPAAALICGAILVMAEGELHEPTPRRRIFFAGVLLGLGYVIRYPALAILPVFLVWPWIRPSAPQDPSSRWMPRMQHASLVLAGFVLGASPQLLLSAIVKGNPFWNTQGANVYMGLVKGGWDPIFYQSIPKGITFLTVLRAHPVALIRHTLENLARVPALELVPSLFLILAWPGVFLSLHRGGLQDLSRYRGRLLSALCLVAFAAAISLAFLLERYLLVCGVLLAAFGGFGYFRVVRPTIDSLVGSQRVGGWLSPFILLYFVLISASAYSISVLLKGQDLTSPSSIPFVSRLVREAGCSDPSKVLALDFNYYDFESPFKTRYSIDWTRSDLQGKFASLQGIAAYMREHHKHLLLYTRHSHTFVSGLSENWPFDTQELERDFERLTPAGSETVVVRLRGSTAC